jgi:hypothetical protein
MSGSLLSLLGVVCKTTRTLAWSFALKLDTSVVNASTPPAEAPITMTSRRSPFAVTSSLWLFSLSGFPRHRNSAARFKPTPRPAALKG